jgi:hypothetical protein
VIKGSAKRLRLLLSLVAEEISLKLMIASSNGGWKVRRLPVIAQIIMSFGNISRIAMLIKH